jgi:hypothetical protein
MDDLKSVLRGTDRQFLEQLQQKYEAQGKAEMVSAVVGELQRQAGEKPVQTLALQDSGKLYQHEYRADDNSGRTFTAYSGDPMVWMQPYMTAAGHTVRTCSENFTGANSPQAVAARAADAQALAVGRAEVARMNRSERTMASQDSGENSAPEARGPEVDRAIEQHGKFLGIFDGKFFR